MTRRVLATLTLAVSILWFASGTSAHALPVISKAAELKADVSQPNLHAVGYRFYRHKRFRVGRILRRGLRLRYRHGRRYRHYYKRRHYGYKRRHHYRVRRHYYPRRHYRKSRYYNRYYYRRHHRPGR